MKCFFLILVLLAGCSQEPKTELATAKARLQVASETKNWVAEHVQNFSAVPTEKQDPLYYIVSLFQKRLDAWQSYKRNFYDEYFSTPTAQKLYPDALPTDFLNEGIYFRILSPNEKVTDTPVLAPLKGKSLAEVYGYQNPGDVRTMDSITAVGSRQLMLVHTEEIPDVYIGQFSIFYHEFGHLVHLTLLTRAEFEAIDAMYASAKTEDRFLDDYAAQSASEYFAVGLEAFVSETKTTNYVYYKHSKADLEQKNPELFSFFKN